jgi:hypothetical protein
VARSYDAIQQETVARLRAFDAATTEAIVRQRLVQLAEMSLELYSTVLVWYGRRGSAKLHGRRVPLTEAPSLPGSLIVMIDYRPEIGERRIQRFDGPATDMTADEVAAADAFLRAALAATR